MKLAGDACGNGYRYSTVLQTCVPDALALPSESGDNPTNGKSPWYSGGNLKDYGSVLGDLIGAFKRSPNTPDTIVYQQAPEEPKGISTGVWVAVAAGVVVLYLLLKK